MSMQTFDETLVSLTASATAVTAAADTILVPDYTLPANYLYQGRTLRAKIYGQVSNVVTAVPTETFKIHLGPLTLSATAVFTSAALATNATANTNLTWFAEYILVCRTSGSSGTVMVTGQLSLPNLTAGNAAGQVGYPNFIPASGPTTGAVDTTVANLLGFSHQWSAAAAGNSIQVVNYQIEALT